jgi:hypothetical protein
VRDDLVALAERAVRTLRELAPEEYEALRQWWRREMEC